MATKRKVSPRKAIETLLSRFVLIGVNGTNQLVGSGSGRIDIKYEQDFKLDTIAPTDAVEYCRIVVRLHLVYSGRREKDEGDVVRLEGTYEGRFMVHPDVSIEQLDEAASGDEQFQYRLVSQVYPLATTHMKEQMQMMGLTTRHLPLGI